jgi:uncharacterized membrane protein
VGVSLIALVPLLVGLVVASVGVLGFRERLPRNRFGGVRTPATLRDDETFRVANRVAGLPVAVGGAVGIVSGGVAFATTGAGLVVTCVVGLVGMVAIAAAGGVLGHRAAEAMPEPAPELPAGCKGCACGGCELTKSVRSDVAGVGGQ